MNRSSKYSILKNSFWCSSSMRCTAGPNTAHAYDAHAYNARCVRVQSSDHHKKLPMSHKQQRTQMLEFKLVGMWDLVRIGYCPRITCRCTDSILSCSLRTDTIIVQSSSLFSSGAIPHVHWTTDEGSYCPIRNNARRCSSPTAGRMWDLVRINYC